MRTRVNDVGFLVFALAQFVGWFHFLLDMVGQFHYLLTNSIFAIFAYLWKTIPLFSGSVPLVNGSYI